MLAPAGLSCLRGRLVSRDALVWASRQHGPYTHDDRVVEPHAIDQAVLYVLADLADRRTSRCFPSITTLGARLRLSRTRLYDALQLWQDLGLLSIEARFSPSGRQRSNFYSLKLHRGKVAPGRAGGGQNQASHQGSDLVGGGEVPRGQNVAGLDPLLTINKKIGGASDPSPYKGSAAPMIGDQGTHDNESAAPMEKDAPAGAKRVSQVAGGDAAYQAHVDRELAALIKARKNA